MTNLFVTKFSKIKGIEAVIFALLLLFLPVNLAKHFFFDFCYVEGILVDYLIPTVYLTDILLWGLLGLWVFRGFRRYRGFRRLFLKNPFILYSLFFILVSGLSTLQATKQPTAVYKWLKLVEYLLLSFYVSKNIDLKKDFFTIVRILSMGVLFESILAIAQWFKQGSIFGYYFFGENKYTVSTPGVATFDFLGSKKVRPYGTMPHPNVLGGYLAILLPWIFYELRLKFKVQSLKFKIFYFLSFISGIATLFLSFSRAAWVVGVFGLLLTVGLGLRRGLTSFLLAPFSSLLATLSIVRRAELNWIALEIIKDHPLLGVGLNNFTVAMDKYGKVSGWTRFLQPVHNVYLLIATEMGLVGLILFLAVLFTNYYLLITKAQHLGALRPLLLVSISQIVLLCFVDHYFFTLQQTSLLFWLLVGLVFATADKV